MIKADSGNHGFTLIETMIVICVLGIMMGFTGMGVARWFPEYRLSSTVLDLKSLIQSARLEAVKNNADVFLQFDINTRACNAFLDNNANGVLDAGDNPPIAEVALPSGIVITGLSGLPAPPGYVTINSRGFSTLSGEVHLQNSRNTYKGVNLTLSGSSRVIRSTDGGATWQ